MALSLPYQQTADRQFNQYQQALKAALAPFTSTPMSSPSLLTSITLKAGSNNVIPHGLNRPLVGWQIVRIRSQATVWDSQDSNTDKAQTLILNTSANVVVDLVVF